MRTIPPLPQALLIVVVAGAACADAVQVEEPPAARPPAPAHDVVPAILWQVGCSFCGFSMDDGTSEEQRLSELARLSLQRVSFVGSAPGTFTVSLPERPPPFVMDVSAHYRSGAIVLTARNDVDYQRAPTIAAARVSPFPVLFDDERRELAVIAMAPYYVSFLDEGEVADDYNTGVPTLSPGFHLAQHDPSYTQESVARAICQARLNDDAAEGCPPAPPVVYDVEALPLDASLTVHIRDDADLAYVLNGVDPAELLQ